MAKRTRSKSRSKRSLPPRTARARFYSPKKLSKGRKRALKISGTVLAVGAVVAGVALVALSKKK